MQHGLLRWPMLVTRCKTIRALVLRGSESCAPIGSPNGMAVPYNLEAHSETKSHLQGSA